MLRHEFLLVCSSVFDVVFQFLDVVDLVLVGCFCVGSARYKSNESFQLSMWLAVTELKRGFFSKA